MRVKLGKYTNWVGPYQVADKVFFWCKKLPREELEARVDYKAKEWLGDFLAYGFQTMDKNNFSLKDTRKHTWFYKLLEWVHSKKTRTVKVHIDYWDHWNVDGTLAPIILPLMKALKEHKHSAGYVDLEDVPPNLRFTETEDYSEQGCFDFYHKAEDKLKCDVFTRYEWVLDEIIWAFEQLQPDYDWEEQYTSGEVDWYSVPYYKEGSDEPIGYTMKHGPEDTYKVDWPARQKHQERINNGLRLFGKYYQSFWD